MNSFAFWCRSKEGKRGCDDGVPCVKAMVNINLWIKDDASLRRDSATAFDFGVMLSLSAPARGVATNVGNVCEGGRDGAAKGAATILDDVDGISLYCPFEIEEKSFSDLMPRLNKETLGAIFNDRCRVSEVDFTSRYVEVHLSKDKENDPFYLLSCEDLEFHKCDEEEATIINVNFPRIARDVREGARRVYVRFRILIDRNSGLIKRSDSRDRLFTSAFSSEETIDLRINDYRTLNEKMREKVDGSCCGVCDTRIVAVHTLLMARTSVAVESFERLHEKRLLEGKNVWGNYLPEGLSCPDVVAWHWKKEYTNPADGYKMYLKLSFSVCNWSTIALYLLFLTSFSIGINAFTNILCGPNGTYSAQVSLGCFALCVILGYVYIKPKKRANKFLQTRRNGNL